MGLFFCFDDLLVIFFFPRYLCFYYMFLFFPFFFPGSFFCLEMFLGIVSKIGGGFGGDFVRGCLCFSWTRVRESCRDCGDFASKLVRVSNTSCIDPQLHYRSETTLKLKIYAYSLAIFPPSKLSTKTGESPYHLRLFGGFLSPAAASTTFAPRGRELRGEELEVWHRLFGWLGSI